MKFFLFHCSQDLTFTVQSSATLGRASSCWSQTLFAQTEQLERRRRQEQEGGQRGPAIKGRGRGEEGARMEIWIRPSGQAATPSTQRGGSESSRDSEQDGELGSLSTSDVRLLSFHLFLIAVSLVCISRILQNIELNRL